MKDMKTTRFWVNYGGKSYRVMIDGTRYSGDLIVNNLKIGNAHYWLILQNESWRFIGDISLCEELKNILAHKIAELHQLPAGGEATVMRGQKCYRTGILLNAVLCALALKNKTADN